MCIVAKYSHMSHCSKNEFKGFSTSLHVYHLYMCVCIYIIAAAAKSLKSRPTLCDPIDCSPSGSSVHEIPQARMLEWVAFFFSRKYSQFSSVAQLCPTLCDPMNRSTPVLPVHHQLPEFTQTHVHRVSDAIQSSHPLLSPSPPAFLLSQHQGLFQ